MEKTLVGEGILSRVLQMNRSWPIRPGSGEGCPRQSGGQARGQGWAWPPGTAPLTRILASTSTCSGGSGRPLAPLLLPQTPQEQVTHAHPFVSSLQQSPGDPFVPSAPGVWGSPCGPSQGGRSHAGRRPPSIPTFSATHAGNHRKRPSPRSLTTTNCRGAVRRSPLGPGSVWARPPPRCPAPGRAGDSRHQDPGCGPAQPRPRPSGGWWSRRILLSEP